MFGVSGGVEGQEPADAGFEPIEAEAVHVAGGREGEACGFVGDERAQIGRECLARQNEDVAASQARVDKSFELAAPSGGDRGPVKGHVGRQPRVGCPQRQRGQGDGCRVEAHTPVELGHAQAATLVEGKAPQVQVEPSGRVVVDGVDAQREPLDGDVVRVDPRGEPHGLRHVVGGRRAVEGQEADGIVRAPRVETAVAYRGASEVCSDAHGVARHPQGKAGVHDVGTAQVDVPPAGGRGGGVLAGRVAQGHEKRGVFEHDAVDEHALFSQVDASRQRGAQQADTPADLYVGDEVERVETCVDKADYVHLGSPVDQRPEPHADPQGAGVDKGVAAAYGLHVAKGQVEGEGQADAPDVYTHPRGVREDGRSLADNEALHGRYVDQHGQDEEQHDGGCHDEAEGQEYLAEGFLLFHKGMMGVAAAEPLFVYVWAKILQTSGKGMKSRRFFSVLAQCRLSWRRRVAHPGGKGKKSRGFSQKRTAAERGGAVYGARQTACRHANGHPGAWAD